MKTQNPKIAFAAIAFVGLAITAYCLHRAGNTQGDADVPNATDVSETPAGIDESSTLDTVTIPDIADRPEGQHFTVNGISMYYEVYGEGEPLLLIPGGTATIESWFCQIPEFRKKYQLIAVDSRGQGRTQDDEGPIDFKLMASDYAGLLDHLALKNVRILGWSDGGVIGFELAMRRPDLVSKIVAFGTHSRPEGMTEEFKTSVEESTPENFPPILSEGYKALSPDGPDHWPVVFGKLKTMWLTQPNFTDDELRSIACPVLLLVGEHDIIRKEESERIARLIPKARLRVLEGASHYAPVEIPDLVNQVAGDFLAGGDDSAGAQ